jgi:hypothetical protein
MLRLHLHLESVVLKFRGYKAGVSIGFREATPNSLSSGKMKKLERQIYGTSRTL